MDKTKINILNTELCVSHKIIETSNIINIDAFLLQLLNTKTRNPVTYHPLLQIPVIYGDGCYTSILKPEIFRHDLRLLNPSKIKCIVICANELPDNLGRYLTNINTITSTLPPKDSISILCIDKELTNFLASIFNIKQSKILEPKFLKFLYNRMCPSPKGIHNIKKQHSADNPNYRTVWDNHAKSIDGIVYKDIVNLFPQQWQKKIRDLKNRIRNEEIEIVYRDVISALEKRNQI